MATGTAPMVGAMPGTAARTGGNDPFIRPSARRRRLHTAADMDALRMADVATRVVAWHNRHPLARRITPADVGGIGVVALPFALPVTTPEGAATAPAPLRAVFGHEWMFRVAPRRLVDWVHRHGRYPLTACAGWPLRQIDADLALAHRADADGLEGRTLRHVLTAVIDVAGHRVRVLLAPAPPLPRAAVFGLRLWSPARTGLAMSGSAAVLVTAWLATMPGAAVGPLGAPAAGHPQRAHRAQLAEAGAPADGPPWAAVQPQSQPVPASAEAPAEAPAPASTPASAPTAGEAPRPQADALAAAGSTPAPTDPTAAAPAAEPEAEPAPEPDRPVDVPVTLADRAAGAAPLVSIRPRLGDADRRGARVAADAVRLASAAPALPGRLFALATPAARSRDHARAQQVLMQGLLAQTITRQPTRLDLMPARGRWRVVWWPHPDRAQAEQLLQAARARGLKVELIEF